MHISYEAQQLLFAEAKGRDKIVKSPTQIGLPERDLAALWISKYYAMVVPKGEFVGSEQLMHDLSSVFRAEFSDDCAKWYAKFTDMSKPLRFDDPASFRSSFLALVNDLIALRRGEAFER